MNRKRSQRIFFRLFLAAALAAITFLATTPRETPVVSGFNDKLNHVLAFFVLGTLTDRSFPGIKFGLIKAIPLMGYGILIECIQYFLPFREFSILDMAADGAGLIIYRVTVAVVNKLRITNYEFN